MQNLKLAKKLGTFDATLIVMGGAVGSGVFMTPPYVAKAAHTPAIMIAAWVFGGLITLLGAFIFAELAWRRPGVQGMYGYLRDAFHPVVAFMAGWTGLLVSITGGIAANGIVFATYFQSLTHWNVSPAVAAVAAIAVLSAINCLGVRQGGTSQNVLMILKGAVIVAIIAAGFFGPPLQSHAPPLSAPVSPPSTLALFGLALVPVLFTYDGWQKAPLLDSELRNPLVSLPRALICGVLAVAVLYIGIAIASWHMLGINGLAASHSPAADMMSAVAGNAGARLVSAGVAISTLGLMSNSILTAPRLYYGMAKDGIFFRLFAALNVRTHAPIAGILIQALIAIAITLSGSYNQILAYVVGIDFIYFAAIGVALFVFRKRERGESRGLMMPGHPWTTTLFILVSAGVAIESYFTAPIATIIGLGILASGIPAYLFWHKRERISH